MKENTLNIVIAEKQRFETKLRVNNGYVNIGNWMDSAAEWCLFCDVLKQHVRFFGDKTVGMCNNRWDLYNEIWVVAIRCIILVIKTTVCDCCESAQYVWYERAVKHCTLYGSHTKRIIPLKEVNLDVAEID